MAEFSSHAPGTFSWAELATTDQGRQALAFIGAQAINVLWTLLLAFLLFGGLIVAQPVIN